MGKPKDRVVVRLTTTWYPKGGNYCQTVTLSPQKRQSYGYDFLKDHIDNAGVAETLALIEDLNGLPDGIYEVVGKWRRSGGYDDIPEWDLDEITLKPFTPEKPNG